MNPATQPPPAKSPDQAPVLTVYGKIADLTKGAVGSRVDNCSNASHNRGNGGC